MKIAIPTTDKVTVAPHTGHAQYFMVVTLEGDQVTGTEFRNNPKCGSEHYGTTEHADDHGCGCSTESKHDHGHDEADDACCGGHGHSHEHGHENDHEHDHEDDHGCGCGSGHSHEIDETHLMMAKSIADCEFFILKQLGGKLATPLQKYDIRPVMIRGEALVNVNDIVQEFVAFAKSNEAQHN